MRNPYQPPADAREPSRDQAAADADSAEAPDDLSDQPGFLFYIAASMAVWGIILVAMVVLLLIVSWLVAP